MAKNRPVNLSQQPGDFGARAEQEAKARALDLLAAEPVGADGPTPEQVAAQHAVALLADEQRRAQDAGAAPAPATGVAEGQRRRWRVSLEGVFVLAFDNRGRALRQDHLEVVATSEWSAVRAFAAHNGIPVARDPLTHQERLASIHRPKVELLGAAD